MRFVSALFLLISILLYRYYNHSYFTNNNMSKESSSPIIVIGGGLAGLCATIEAATLDPSVKIILVDKEGNIG